MLVATGKTDWVRDVADEEGSVMEAIERGGVLPGNGVCFSFYLHAKICDMWDGVCVGIEANDVWLRRN